jgi:hypothetical protein
MASGVGGVVVLILTDVWYLEYEELKYEEPR